MMHLLTQLLQEQCGLQEYTQPAGGARHLCVEEPSVLDVVQENACHCRYALLLASCHAAATAA